MGNNIAIVISVLSLGVSAAVWWVSHEKLRLDLYNRRFDIYSRALDLYQVLLIPGDSDSDLDNAQRAFIKASRESRFLFDKSSGVHQLLEQMHTDAVAIIGYRDEAPKFTGPDAVQFNEKFNESMSRMHAAIPLLEEGMAKYLNFHAVFVLPD
jgi:hypothetical protein